MGDLDLLLEKHQLTKAAKVIEKLQYEPSLPEIATGIDQVIGRHWQAV